MKKLTNHFLLPVLIAAVSACLAADVPFLTGRVTDNAKILSAETNRSLTELLKAHEDSTGNQIAILTVPSLDGESIEDFTYRVFNEWKLGEKEKDNGILILVAPNDRAMRIEVGYGLEAVLPDGMAGDIIRNKMTPRFKEGDYDGGIAAGARAVVGILEGGNARELAAGEGGTSRKSGSPGFEGPDLPLHMRILFGAFIFGIIGLFTAMGILTPGVGWFLYFFLIPFWAMFPIIVVGTKGALACLATYLVGFPIAKLFLKKTDWYKKAAKDLKSKGTANIGGFTLRSGGGSGRSWSSGGSSFSSGSSFSGGGGSSGGGGASGSW
ncbi:TPM domain-containing protein [bacterium]|nr:TPM domain-containing protein [bacterium]